MTHHDAREPAVETFLPLSPPAFHVLAALADGEQHGWGIRKHVERLTDGRLQLGTGTLYGLIKRLSAQELIAESDQRPPARWDDERRRYYRLTRLGQRVFEAEAERMRRALAVARLVGPGLEPGTA